MNPSLLWFRSDLRLADNPALTAAIKRGRPVVPVFIWSPEEDGAWSPGAAGKWWLHASLRSFEAALRRRGSRLVLRRGPALEALRDLARSTGADAVFWNRCYEPAAVARDERIKRALNSDGTAVETGNSALLFEPGEIRNAAGGPFKVFTPFWRKCLGAAMPAEPTAAPRRIPPPSRWPSSIPLPALELEPKINWAGGMRETWTPGERGAQAALKRFLHEALAEYSSARDLPGAAGTSRLSPHLHFGEIGPRQILRAMRARVDRGNGRGRARAAAGYARQLGWREFAYHLLHHFPHTTDQPLRAEFAAFPWKKNAGKLRAWQRGLTGYPFVDAGMRELWETGWMHNRARMVAASFLVKDLFQPWQEGAKWFWDTLVDADLANNTLGWQWTAGCGADAAPFFRIFNPVSQGVRFDPEGDYVRRWVPELAKLPGRWIHRPWEAPAASLRAAGIVLGKTYPRPIVDHATARAEALEAFAGLKRAKHRMSA